MKNHNKDKNPNYRHGNSSTGKWTRTYSTWVNMKQRCNNKKSISYKWYGAKGISYDNRWEIFSNFLEDMGDKPDGMTLERIDNNKGYSKENCKWSTRLEQSLNKSWTIYLTYKGKKMTLHEWAKYRNIEYMTLYTRIRVYRWDTERALNYNLIPTK